MMNNAHLYIPPNIISRGMHQIPKNNGIVITDEYGKEIVLYNPHPKQLEFHQRTEPNVLFWGGRGSGKSTALRWEAHARALAHPGFTYIILRRTYPELQKALALDVVVPTTEGMKTIADISVGDTVFAPDGTPTQVLGKSGVFVEPKGTFKLTFDDGEEIVASAEHEWVTLTAKERNALQRVQNGRCDKPRCNITGVSRTVEEIFNTLLTEHGHRSNHAVVLAKPLQMSTKVLPIDPYVLGVWLGDGTSGQGAVTTADPVLFKYFEAAGYEVRQRPSHKYAFGILGLAKDLKATSVFNNKHIPEEYFLGSCDQRLSLLQGLMDTDGSCRVVDGLCSFTNTNKRKGIAEGVFRLAASLGLKPHWDEGLNVFGPVYTVYWTTDMPVFRLQRKLQRQTLRARRKTLGFRYIVNCERTADTPCQCLIVAHPSHQFLVGRAHIPTHNSHLIHIPREMRQLGGTFTFGDKIAAYPNGSKGFFSHCQSEEDVLNLLSAEFAWAGFDELSTFEWEMFTKLSASVRVPIWSGLIAMVRAATNPLGPSASKILEYFVDKQVDPEEDPDYNPNDWFSIHANLEDNPSLDQVQYRKRFSGLPNHVRKAWVDGEFVLENALFDMEARRDGKPWHVINDIDMKAVIKASTIYRAIDAGWFPDPTLCLWIAHLGNRFIVIKEKLWYKTIAVDIAADIKEIDEQLGISRVSMTYCDPSMNINTTADVRTLKDVYEENGIAMECSVNNREMFASSVHAALGQQAGETTPRIQFYSNGRDGCPYLVKTIPQQRFDPKKPLRMADHKDDHAVVTLAYFLISSGSMDRQSTQVTNKLRPWMIDKNQKPFILGSESVRDR